jgi:2-isopropylmalate synthase
LQIAKKLEELGVDIIEAGFAVSNGDGETMRRIAEAIKGPYISGLARCNAKDIDATYMALKDCQKRMLHVFIATSKMHAETKLKKTPAQILEMAGDSVRYGKQYFDKIEFSAEDATRSDMEFLKEIFSEVIHAGATTINIPDSVGCAYPADFGKMIAELSVYLRQIKPAIIISVHCHNDRGLALANTLEGIANGANQAEVSVNGLGERAGNCSIEQVVANGMLEGAFYHTNADPRQLYEVSQMVAEATKIRNDAAPIVGKTAFAHKSGIHQDGVIKNKGNYEIFNPEDFSRKSEIVIGPHSGHHGMIAKARELGRIIDEDFARRLLEIVSDRVKNEKRKNFTDSDLHEIFLEASRF